MGPVEASARQVEEACRRWDPAEIQNATVELSRLTAQAVARIYAGPKSGIDTAAGF
jgi:hypothetical protein